MIRHDFLNEYFFTGLDEGGETLMIAQQHFMLEMLYRSMSLKLKIFCRLLEIILIVYTAKNIGFLV